MLPQNVTIREVGLREGLQIAKKVLPLTEKLELIKLINRTGVKEVELTAFVRADRVPQMADAEELVKQYERLPGINYSALCLNTKGLERAVSSGRLDCKGWIYYSASETFLKNNNNLSRQQFLDSLSRWQLCFERLNISFHGLMLSNAFGCSYEGNIPTTQVIEDLKLVLKRMDDVGLVPNEISIADTVGMGNPQSVQNLIGELKSQYPELDLSLHLHDTRGLGLLNAYAGMCEGVSIFECSVGGVGGCPFTPGAAGNLASEDLAYLCGELGIETGLNLAVYCKLAIRLEYLLGPAALTGHIFRVL